MVTDRAKGLWSILPMASRLIIIAFAVVILLNGIRPSPEAKPNQEKVWTVNAINATPQTSAPIVNLYGRIESPKAATYSAAITAFVKKVHVLEGNYVNKGSALITLDARDVRLTYEQRKAEVAEISARLATEKTKHDADQEALLLEKEMLSLANKSAARFQELSSKQLSAANQFDEATRSARNLQLTVNRRKLSIQDYGNRVQQLSTQKQRASALRDQAKLELNRSRVTAAINGRIAKVHVAPGDRVRPGESLISLFDTGALEIRAQIPSRLINIVRQGISEQGSLNAFTMVDQQKIPLTLTRLAGQVTTGRGGIDGLFQLPSTEVFIELGRSTEVYLELPEQQNTIAVPPQAIHGVDRLYLIKDTRLQAVNVEIVGNTTQNDQPYILIRSSDISKGDSIMTTQLPSAISGMKVRRVGEKTQTEVQIATTSAKQWSIPIFGYTLHIDLQKPKDDSVPEEQASLDLPPETNAAINSKEPSADSNANATAN